jgi:hypothetical protein
MPSAMRDSNRSVSRRYGCRSAAILAVALLAAACGGAAPTTAPTRAPVAVATPVPSVDPHLKSPATLEDVYKTLQRAGLEIVANTAGSGKQGAEPRRTLVATYAGWPLIINEYSSAKALAKAKKWKKGAKPGYGEPAVAIRGMNILVEYGPTTGRRPPKPEGAQREAVVHLVEALDPILHPLRARANVTVKIPKHTPRPAPNLEPSASPS